MIMGASLSGFATLIVLGGFILIAVLAINQWKRNNASPRLSVEAAVVKKYTEVTQHNMPVGGDPSGALGTSVHTTTQHYAVFRVESGDTLTFCISSDDFAALEQGQSGKLHFQGSRFQGFEQQD